MDEFYSHFYYDGDAVAPEDGGADVSTLQLHLFCLYHSLVVLVRVYSNEYTDHFYPCHRIPILGRFQLAKNSFFGQIRG